MEKASQSKRPVRQLSLHEKLSAIQRVHEGESKASVARIIGVPESTLRGWCKNEDKLLALANKSSPSPDPEKPEGPPDAKRARFDARDPLWYWLCSQQQQPNVQALKDMDNSSWFWKWYKQFGFQSPTRENVLEPLALVKSKSTLDNVFFNLNNNNVRDETKENRLEDLKEVSEDEDEPPETADEALKHGEKFLRWLECCSDPNVTAVQLLQFRYLLNNVRSCAERQANKSNRGPRVRRK